MSEADWWLCRGCSSLNNLSASKCYSCGQRKPKDPTRASEYLNYKPVVSWDGKVTMEQLPFESAPPASPAGEEPQAQAVLPTPLREPLPRDTLAVAPRPPHPARITYGLEPQPRPTPALSDMPAPGTAEPPVPNPAPLVAVGPAPWVVPQSSAEQWPHWRELLDSPTPHAENLRPSSPIEEDSPLARRVGAAQAAASHSGSTLQGAMKQARGESSPSRPFVPWPEADLQHREIEQDHEGG